MKDKKDIFEIRIHGRGGQGAKTAAQFIAEAALEKGKFIQSFPEYGPERSGAPMKAFARISDKEIKTYAPVTAPDVVMVLDQTLVGSINITDGLAKEGVLIVNTSNTQEWLKKKTNFFGKCITIDATKISLETIGINMPNTPMIGSLIKATNIVTLDVVENIIKKKFLKKIGEKATNANIEAIKRAYIVTDINK